ncbi:MAG: HU family DNA-binding protein [Cyanobacteriota bacterium]|nr:HU family DNA-binding protein [Cyanobacteriota bacterium]
MSNPAITLTSLKQRSHSRNDGVTKKQVSSIINGFLDDIKGELIEGNIVNIHNFARFSPPSDGDTAVPSVKWSKTIEFSK